MPQVAAVSGDVRRALELCRKAAEIAEEQQWQQSADAQSDRAAGSSGSPPQTQLQGA
jgi:Cdc6-like AAA superfamily ATPase